MIDITEQVNFVDIQHDAILEADSDRMFDILNELAEIKCNDVCYRMNFNDFLNEDGSFDQHFGPLWKELYDLLSKYVPTEKLTNPFVFSVWW